MTRLRIIHIFVVSLLLLELGVYLSYAAIPGQETVEVNRDDLQVSKTVAENYHADHNRAEDIKVNALADDSCISQPNQTSCVNYKLPNVESDVEMLCEHMPHMAGCSVDNMCQSHGGHLNPSVYCTPFSILKDICSGEMATMSGCTNYTKMCGPVNSVVKECATQSLPLPSDAQLSQWISQICKSMPMTNCKQCGLNTRRSTRRSTAMAGTLNCDLLLVYSELCLSMPDMSQCTGWSQLCQIIPDWPLCPGGDDDEAPIMRMYFHASIADYVLLEQWVPRNWWEYLATFFAIIVMGILYEGLKTVRSVLEERWNAEGREGNLGDSGGSIQDLTGGSGEEDIHHHHHGGRMKWKFDWVPFRWWVDIPRACFIFVEVGAGLILMLVAMTFNVGLFLAVCCGAFFGSLIFGRLSAKFTKALCH